MDNLINSLGSSTVLSKVVFLTPGSTSFPGAQNHYIITLMQWQFWWWFWFTGMLAIYDAFYARFFYNRLPYLAPKIVTSYRSHGRWGDLIICLIPVGWCMNILSNSHFLLRALEWQTETAPFFLRVRGKQWYWVYKIDLNNFNSIEEIPKIIGRGKKVQFSKPTIDSTITTHRFIELGYVEGNRQEQVFTKINPNTNKDYHRGVQVRFSGRTNIHVVYKGAFNKLRLPLRVDCGDASHVGLYVDPKSMPTDLELQHPPELGPPKRIIRGEPVGLCSNYWETPIVRPYAFSNLLDSVFEAGTHNSKKLLWTLTYNIVLKEQLQSCRKSRIANVQKLINPTAWPLLMRRIRGSDTITSRIGPVWIHVYDIPYLGAKVSRKSLFSELINGTCPVERRESIYKLITKRVDFTNSMPRITKVALGYKIIYFRKSQLLNTYRLKFIWNNRLVFVKNHLHSIKLYLGLFKTPKVCVKTSWLGWFYMVKFFKKQNTNVINKSSVLSVFRVFAASVGRATWKKVIMRLTNRTMVDGLVHQFNLLNAIHPPKKNPYLELFCDISKFERRHLVHRLDPCALMIKRSFWNPQLNLFHRVVMTTKIMRDTYDNWCTYKLLYNSNCLLLNALTAYRVGSPFNGEYSRVRPTLLREARAWSFVQRNRSSSRWAKNNYLNQINFVLLKAPLNSSKPLVLGYYYPNEKPVKVVTPNVSITIKQKKVEKTIFGSKLNQKQFTHSTDKGTLVYSKLDGAIKLIPGYNYVDQHSFKNGGGDRTLKSNGPTLNKSYLHQRRLLWVNKVLLLPTHVAITIVTNSYDVIHSWFIPGLGLKLDCVPGRSTHHTIYIEYGGYYYGQCAEVCGRRHHHMPIKIRAIPFMIFSYWWRNQIREDFLKNLT